jgi:hypothetical protein
MIFRILMLILALLTAGKPDAQKRSCVYVETQRGIVQRGG